MKRIFLLTLKSIGAIIGLVIFYITLVLILPLIPIDEEETAEPKNIPIYLLTNGVHTDLVLPTKTSIVDWSLILPYQNTRSQQTDFKHIAIGWGDKGFYLDTPTWADLKVSTAIKASFWLGESAMHCTYYNEITESEHCKKIMLTSSQYQNLVNYI